VTIISPTSTDGEVEGFTEEPLAAWSFPAGPAASAIAGFTATLAQKMLKAVDPSIAKYVRFAIIFSPPMIFTILLSSVLKPQLLRAYLSFG